MPGIHLEDYLENMIAFRKQYPGRFLIEAALFRGVNDSDEELEKLKKLLQRLQPDEVIVIEFTHPEKIYRAFGIGEERLVYAREFLKNYRN